MKNLVLGYSGDGGNRGSFLDGPEVKAIGFAFFETELFEGFADTYDSTGGGGDVYVGPFGDTVEDLSRGEKIGCPG